MSTSNTNTLKSNDSSNSNSNDSCDFSDNGSGNCSNREVYRDNDSGDYSDPGDLDVETTSSRNGLCSTVFFSDKEYYNNQITVPYNISFRDNKSDDSINISIECGKGFTNFNTECDVSNFINSITNMVVLSLKCSYNESYYEIGKNIGSSLYSYIVKSFNEAVNQLDIVYNCIDIVHKMTDRYVNIDKEVSTIYKYLYENCVNDSYNNNNPFQMTGYYIENYILNNLKSELNKAKKMKKMYHLL